jgi:osmotically-inducible protein OsmY
MKTNYLLLAVVALPLLAQPPDNTKRNQRDRDPAAVTADQQGNSKGDISRTAAIRKAIGDRKELSTYAQNVKVITLNNHVTLRGPVRNEQERTMIGNLAMDIAGAQNVTNNLEIAPDTERKNNAAPKEKK